MPQLSCGSPREKTCLRGFRNKKGADQPVHLGRLISTFIIPFLESLSKFATSAYEPRHEISNNVVCVASKASDQTAHTLSLIRDFASLLNIP